MDNQWQSFNKDREPNSLRQLKLSTQSMKLNILTALTFLFIGCTQKAQHYSYELEDSDEAYVMDSWTADHKEDYYKKVGNLLHEFLTREHYTTPSESEFNKKLKEKLKISVNKKSYQIIPYPIFQKDSTGGDALRLVVFPQQRIISFDSEFPLLNTSSLTYYHSPDYKNLDHSSDYNIVLNKILLTPDQKEIDKWLKDEQLQDLFIYLVCSFHFDSNEPIFRHVIGHIKNDPEKYNSEYLRLLFYRDKKEIDREFLSKIKEVDPDRKLLVYFRNAIAEEFNKKDRERYEKGFDAVYR